MRDIHYGTYVDTDLAGKSTRGYVECRNCPHMAYDFAGKRAARRAAQDHADTHPGARICRDR